MTALSQLLGIISLLVVIADDPQMSQDAGSCRVPSQRPRLPCHVCHDPDTSPAPMGPNREMAPRLSPPGALGSLKLSYSLLLTSLSSFPSAAY